MSHQSAQKQVPMEYKRTHAGSYDQMGTIRFLRLVVRVNLLVVVVVSRCVHQSATHHLPPPVRVV